MGEGKKEKKEMKKRRFVGSREFTEKMSNVVDRSLELAPLFDLPARSLFSTSFSFPFFFFNLAISLA